MWCERHSINRIVRKVGRAVCAAAYALHVMDGFSPRKIGLVLRINRQTAASAIRAGRALNDADGYAPADIRAGYAMRATLRNDSAANGPEHVEALNLSPTAVPMADFVLGIARDRANAERVARLYAHAG